MLYDDRMIGMDSLESLCTKWFELETVYTLYWAATCSRDIHGMYMEREDGFVSQ